MIRNYTINAFAGVFKYGLEYVKLLNTTFTLSLCCQVGLLFSKDTLFTTDIGRPIEEIKGTVYSIIFIQ